MIKVQYCGNVYEVVEIGNNTVKLMGCDGEYINIRHGTFLNECDSMDAMIDYKKVLPDSIFKKER